MHTLAEAQLRPPEDAPAAEPVAQSTPADPLLLYLLANARSAAVREEFLRLPSETYTAARDIKIFVRGTGRVGVMLFGRLMVARQSSLLYLPRLHRRGHTM